MWVRGREDDARLIAESLTSWIIVVRVRSGWMLPLPSVRLQTLILVHHRGWMACRPATRTEVGGLLVTATGPGAHTQRSASSGLEVIVFYDDYKASVSDHCAAVSS
jgi:hypothetical protein